ncbi:GrxA family glutaredoxin [Billgrantia gudaonensis]|uniref:GrxA family glutaredoxin n=1 Tax=Billgrantia gudaonensis TaxID=376427 RepID=A0A3S0QFF1_9GAMM|nr:GrxA family glutaredoxin [Halomonas gudaonensis]
MFVVIYGRPGCLLHSRPVTGRAAQPPEPFRDSYVNIWAGGISKAELAERIGKPVHTVPQIFVDQRHVGGFTEFDQFVREHGLLAPSQSA